MLHQKQTNHRAGGSWLEGGLILECLPRFHQVHSMWASVCSSARVLRPESESSLVRAEPEEPSGGVAYAGQWWQGGVPGSSITSISFPNLALPAP